MGFPEGLPPPSKDLWARSEQISNSMFPDGPCPDVVTPHNIDPGITREVTGVDLSSGEVVTYELGGGPVLSLDELDEAKQDPRVQGIIAKSIRHHAD